MRFCFVLFFLFLITSTEGQTNTIKGIVVSADGNFPLANCNVFISNSSKGTMTDAEGKFTLSQIPEGNSLDLLVSNAGYETYVYTFSTKDLPLDLNIKLNKKIINLAAVVITNADPNGWENWGKVFRDKFLGESDNGNSCKIENFEVLKFRYNKRENKLTVDADSILIIKNVRLGYIVKYQLEDFVYNMNAQTIRYTGYPVFEELEPDSNKRVAYIARRSRTYIGSMLHFMRAVYNDQLAEQRYKVVKTEPEAGYGTLGNDGRAIQIDIGGAASNEPKKNKRSQNVNEEQEGKKEIKYITRKDILFKGSDSTRNVLSFDNYLSITINEPEDEGYAQFTGYEQKSRLYILTDEKRITIEPNGRYYPALDLLIEGYMTWKKVGDLLPFDYTPPEKKKKSKVH
ncbi:MAG: carboxypeptidase-like regulatory domain-containing protein [Ferruginibacter sp.]